MCCTKKIISALSSGALEYDKLSNKAAYKSSGRLSEYLQDLITAGFIARDYAWNISRGKQTAISTFRLSDNYLRFYLKYIEPKRAQIEKGDFRETSLNSLPGWETMMGLQFENLVVNNRELLLKKLNIPRSDIVYDNPFIQHATKQKIGCQIDYMIQTRYKNIYLCEIKFSRQPVSNKVIDQIEHKIKSLAVPKGFVVLPVLIHINGVSESVVKKSYFYSIVDFGDLLK